ARCGCGRRRGEPGGGRAERAFAPRARVAGAGQVGGGGVGAGAGAVAGRLGGFDAGAGGSQVGRDVVVRQRRHGLPAPRARLAGVQVRGQGGGSVRLLGGGQRRLGDVDRLLGGRQVPRQLRLPGLGRSATTAPRVQVRAQRG